MKRELKKQVLTENCNAYNSECDIDKMSVADYAKREAENDPDFFRWLFDDDTISDFGTSLNEYDINRYKDFLKTL